MWEYIIVEFIAKANLIILRSKAQRRPFDLTKEKKIDYSRKSSSPVRSPEFVYEGSHKSKLATLELTEGIKKNK